LKNITPSYEKGDGLEMPQTAETGKDVNDNDESIQSLEFSSSSPSKSGLTLTPSSLKSASNGEIPCRFRKGHSVNVMGGKEPVSATPVRALEKVLFGKEHKVI